MLTPERMDEERSFEGVPDILLVAILHHLAARKSSLVVVYGNEDLGKRVAHIVAPRVRMDEEMLIPSEGLHLDEADYSLQVTDSRSRFRCVGDESTDLAAEEAVHSIESLGMRPVVFVIAKASQESDEASPQGHPP
jgi:hypothetical protein